MSYLLSSAVTTIPARYPQKFSSAQVVMTDKNGKTIKAINIAGMMPQHYLQAHISIHY